MYNITPTAPWGKEATPTCVISFDNEVFFSCSSYKLSKDFLEFCFDTVSTNKIDQKYMEGSSIKVDINGQTLKDSYRLFGKAGSNIRLIRMYFPDEDRPVWERKRAWESTYLASKEIEGMNTNWTKVKELVEKNKQEEISLAIFVQFCKEMDKTFGAELRDVLIGGVENYTVESLAKSFVANREDVVKWKASFKTSHSTQCVPVVFCLEYQPTDKRWTFIYSPTFGEDKRTLISRDGIQSPRRQLLKLINEHVYK